MSSPVMPSIFVSLIFALVALANADNCVPRDFGHGSVVCVCNSTYCDYSTVNVPERGRYRSYESSKAGKRLSEKVGHFDSGTSDNTGNGIITLKLHPDERFQQIHGFGGAFTDSTGINMRKLSEGSQNQIVETYYGVNGSRYTLGRVPIAGSDFSTRPYTYDDHENDVSLERFGLANEDYMYKIPLMKKARMTSPSLRFLSSAWTAPPWMKTNNNFTGYGYLRKEYYQTYADYMVKFLNEYKKQGLNIWAVTTGNEPEDTLSPTVRFSTMGWTPDTMGQWVGNNLGPTIASSESNDTIILILDDQRYNLPWYVADVFENPVAMDYTAGIAVHWYGDPLVLPVVIDETNDLFPEKFLLLTEACVGSASYENYGVVLGSWDRAETYISRMMENLNHWMTGFIDWNMVLDKTGGPNWAQNYVDAAIIVNPQNDEFFKQPIYYAITHFSKFVKPGSTRIGLTPSGDIESIAFETGDKEIVILLYNRGNDELSVNITDPEQGTISTTISPLSIQTIIYER